MTLSEPEMYAGSDGWYYTDWQRRQALASGQWTRCLRIETESSTSTRELVATETGALLMLISLGTDLQLLPHWVRVESDGRRVTALDTRQWRDGPSRKKECP